MHDTYHNPSITDLAVLRAQAERRRDKQNEPTVLHFHPYEHECNDQCEMYRPGEATKKVVS